MAFYWMHTHKYIKYAYYILNINTFITYSTYVKYVLVCVCRFNCVTLLEEVLNWPGIQFLGHLELWNLCSLTLCFCKIDP